MLRSGFVWSRVAAVVTVWVWAAASQAAVTVDVAPGFGGTAREFAWTPIAVKLTNPDDRPILQPSQRDHPALLATHRE